MLFQGLMFQGLLRCPLCRARPTDALGCCSLCRQGLFAPQALEAALTLGVYQGRLERAVRAFKFKGVRRLARFFGEALAEEAAAEGHAFDVVCAVPLHWGRRWQRGYNQSELLAKVVAQELNLPYRRALRRKRATRQQARLGRTERLENVRGAFESLSLKGARVLLIDDVVTSGATTRECAQALLRAGATSVRVAAIARA